MTPIKTGEAEACTMSFIEHLEEARSMIIRMALTVTGGFLICWVFRSDLRTLLIKPLIAVLPEGSKTLIFTKVPEGFLSYLWISAIAGLILTSPVLFYWLWNFIAPGLYRTERIYVLSFISVSSMLFIGGSILAYFFVFPIGFTFFMQFGDATIMPMIRLSDYLDFSSKLILAFGLVFETPIVLIFLTKMGIVDPKTLAKKRKYVILLIFVVAAVITPPDVITQLMMAGPLLLLFEVSLLVSRWFKPKNLDPQAPSS